MSGIKIIYDPCVGCGYCCLKWPCTPRWETQKGRCAKLQWSEEDQRYWCLAGREDAAFAKLMSMGEGCPSNLNTWRKEVIDRG